MLLAIYFRVGTGGCCRSALGGAILYVGYPVCAADCLAMFRVYIP